MEIALDRPRRLTIPAHTHLALAGLLRVYQAALGGSGTEGARLPTGLRGAVEMKSLRQMDLGDEDVRALVKARVLHLVAEGPPESPQLSSVPADPIRLAPSSCLALTADGATQVAKISGVRALGSLFDASGKWIIDFALLRTARPRWDEERRELSFGPLLVKRYRQPARDQELILTAFAEEGWPPRMDDPIAAPASSTRGGAISKRGPGWPGTTNAQAPFRSRFELMRTPAAGSRVKL